jgi:hypothetical protein
MLHHRRNTMPLYPNALAQMRANLQALAKGERAERIEIGELKPKQLKALNDHRIAGNPNLKPVVATVVFIGRHVHLRRILDDGYTIDDALDQIVAAMAETSVFDGGTPMQRIKSATNRTDRYGNTKIRDCMVLECTSHRPNPELFSVIPKGDNNKPPEAERATPSGDPPAKI